MSDYNSGFSRQAPAVADMSVDAGLRSFMLGVYNKLALGLLLSAALAYITYSVPAVHDLLYFTRPDGGVGITTLGMAIRFLPLAAILVAMFAMRNPTARSSGALYWFIVASFGLGAGVWMMIYTSASVASAFLITSVAFGSLSLVGYTTKRDMTGFGNFLIMGLVGLVLAMIVNMFLHLAAMVFVINVLGVLIFSGLIAYDTQKLKMTYYALGGDQAKMAVATNYGALNLYLDFINLFQFLLSLMGSRR
jgi:FtsH-binding integral membrane protein